MTERRKFLIRRMTIPVIILLMAVALVWVNNHANERSNQNDRKIDQETANRKIAIVQAQADEASARAISECETGNRRAAGQLKVLDQQNVRARIAYQNAIASPASSAEQVANAKRNLASLPAIAKFEHDVFAPEKCPTTTTTTTKGHP